MGFPYFTVFYLCWEPSPYYFTMFRPFSPAISCFSRVYAVYLWKSPVFWRFSSFCWCFSGWRFFDTPGPAARDLPRVSIRRVLYRNAPKPFKTVQNIVKVIFSTPDQKQHFRDSKRPSEPNKPTKLAKLS